MVEMSKVASALLGLAGGVLMGVPLGMKVAEPKIADAQLASTIMKIGIEIFPSATSSFIVPVDPANPRVKVFGYEEPPANKPYVQVALVGVEDQDPTVYGDWTDVLIRAYQDKNRRKTYLLVACTGDWRKIVRYNTTVVLDYPSGGMAKLQEISF